MGCNGVRSPSLDRVTARGGVQGGCDKGQGFIEDLRVGGALTYLFSCGLVPKLEVCYHRMLLASVRLGLAPPSCSLQQIAFRKLIAQFAKILRFRATN